jgi:hypothetical protein
MLERLHQHMASHPGVRFVTMNEMADNFSARELAKKNIDNEDPPSKKSKK